MSNETKQGRIIGYVRVSTEEQNTERQLAVMEGVDKLFVDKMSGKNMDRKGLQEMLSYVQAGDTIRVKSIDRLARSTRDLLSILDDLHNRDIEVYFVDTPFLNSTKKEGRFFLTILGALAELERVTIKERQAEGIAIAKAKGVYDQDPKLSLEQVAEIRRRLHTGDSYTGLAREFGVSRITVYNALRGEGAYSKYMDELNAMDLPPIPTREELYDIKRKHGTLEINRRKSYDKKPKLSLEQVAKLRCEIGQGKTFRMLADEFGVSIQTARQAFHGRGVYSKYEDNLNSMGVPDRLTSEELQRIGYENAVRQPRVPQLTIEQVAELRRQIWSGKTREMMAEEYEVSLNTIKNALNCRSTYKQYEDALAEMNVPRLPTRKEYKELTKACA